MFYSQAHCIEESTRGETKIILLTLEMARQEVNRTTHIEEGELRVTHENAILTNITTMFKLNKLTLGSLTLSKILSLSCQKHNFYGICKNFKFELPKTQLLRYCVKVVFLATQT